MEAVVGVLTGELKKMQFSHIDFSLIYQSVTAALEGKARIGAVLI